MIVYGIHEKLRPTEIALHWGVAGWSWNLSETAAAQASVIIAATHIKV